MEIAFPPPVMVAVADCNRNPSYQRPTDERRAEAIAADFQPDLFGSLTLATEEASEGDRFDVINGGTRLRGAELAGIEAVPAVFAAAVTPAEAAALFVRLNSLQRKPTALQMHLSNKIAGVAMDLDIERLLAEVGWTIPSPRIKCISALTRVYGRWGPDAVASALQSLKPLHLEPTEAWLVGGAVEMFGRHPDADPEHLADVMHDHYAPIDREVRRRGEKGTWTRSKISSDVLWKFYNRKLRAA